MTPERLGLLWGITVFSGAAARLVAAISGWPGVVLLLLSGLLIGRSGLGLVEPLDLGPGLGTVVGLLVSLVLFDGGLNLRLPGDTIRTTVQRIAVLRLMISLGAGLLAAHWLAGLSWSVAAVFSAIVLATGPTVVTPLVRQIKLAPPLGDVLEAEGLVLEPIGAVLALLLLELVLGNLHGWREVAVGLLQRLGGGILIGASVGWLLSELLRRLNPDRAAGLPLQLSLGLLFLMYGVSEWLLPESALPASVAAGLVVGRRPTPYSEALDNLIQELAQLAITMLFPLLAADVSWAELSPLGWGGDQLRADADGCGSTRGGGSRDGGSASQCSAEVISRLAGAAGHRHGIGGISVLHPPGAGRNSRCRSSAGACVSDDSDDRGAAGPDGTTDRTLAESGGGDRA